MMDMFKSENITAIFTSLSQPGAALEQTEFGVSSFVDTWLLLRDHEVNGERNKLMYVLKSRGTAHSNQVREFVITDNGIKLIDVYAGSEGLLTGSSRIAEEAKTKIHEVELQNRLTTKQKKLQYEQKVTEAQIKSLSAQLKMQEQELRNIHSVEQYRQDTVVSGKAVMRAARGETKLVRNNGKR
jgi:circadian clock protein KaiC